MSSVSMSTGSVLEFATETDSSPERARAFPSRTILSGFASLRTTCTACVSCVLEIAPLVVTATCRRSVNSMSDRIRAMSVTNDIPEPREGRKKTKELECMVADVVMETYDTATLYLFTGNEHLTYEPGHFIS